MAESSLQIVCDETDDFDREIFENAADHLTKIVSNVSNDQLLYLYARFKQVKDGPCHVAKPGFFNFQAKQKWEAWKNVGDMSTEQAMREYIEEVDRIDPQWRQKDDTRPRNGTKETLGLAVSTLRGAVDEENQTPSDDQKTVFDWVKEGNVQRVTDILERIDDVNGKDEEGMSLLHWASDRGNIDLVHLLVSRGSNLNQTDSDGQTALHYASSCGHSEVVKWLLKSGADVTVEDDDGSRPKDVAADLEIASLFCVK